MEAEPRGVLTFQQLFIELFPRAKSHVSSHDHHLHLIRSTPHIRHIMNFSRFPRANMFDFRAPRESAQASDGNSTVRLHSPGPAAPAPPILTRPRTGSGIRDPVEDMATQDGPGLTDSLTLGQLKAHAAAVQPKPKVYSTSTRPHGGLIPLITDAAI